MLSAVRGEKSGSEDFGHDLPDAEFYCDADMIIARLADLGFQIAQVGGRQIEIALDTLIGPIRFDAGTYRIVRVSAVEIEPPF